MQEIKFRHARLKPDGTFLDFHYWGFIDGAFIPPKTYLFASTSDVQAASQQYTGLKDRNGVEIFEGDIIRHHEFQKEVVTGVVGLEKSICGWRSKVGILHLLIPEVRSEVIGNIHQNPELINQQ